MASRKQSHTPSRHCNTVTRAATTAYKGLAGPGASAGLSFRPARSSLLKAYPPDQLVSTRISPLRRGAVGGEPRQQHDHAHDCPQRLWLRIGEPAGKQNTLVCSSRLSPLSAQSPLGSVPPRRGRVGGEARQQHGQRENTAQPHTLARVGVEQMASVCGRGAWGVSTA